MVFFEAAAHVVEAVANFLGIAVIALGLGQMVGALVRQTVVRRQLPGHESRFAFARWLALSLELMLAADIVGTIVAPSWREIGRLAAIVGLRSALNYFLAKELEHARRGEDLAAGDRATQRPAAAEPSR